MIHNVLACANVSIVVYILTRIQHDAKFGGNKGVWTLTGESFCSSLGAGGVYMINYMNITLFWYLTASVFVIYVIDIALLPTPIKTFD